jgi:hypothetical protein
MKRLLLAVLVLAVCGCASKPKFTITSSTPAYIEYDGIVICETTPCTMTPRHWQLGLGICDPSSSYQSVIVAFPIDKTKGFTQSKAIRATCNDDKKVYFDMLATTGVQTVPAVQ